VNRIRFLFLIALLAIGLTVIFWWPLYGGAGFIGGDLYPYFFPQKAFYADHLKQGKFPLWNDLSGFGYPVLGESQTGAAYPLHLILYRCLDLNTAYNVEHLLHYILCFVATALFAKRLGLSDSGSLLCALVFTYGWFPPRACLEWAILTGAWLPVSLLCVESFLQTGWWRYAIGLSISLGLQLLAGHYHLAFITQLLVVSYSGLRLWVEQRRPSPQNEDGNKRHLKQAALGLVLAGIAGVSLAAVQVWPTWELKQRSSRIVTGGDYDPAYGHMPPLYASQLVAPWLWYNPRVIDEDNLIRDIAEFLAPWHWFGNDKDLDELIKGARAGALNNGTNKVEAHVYCGVIPVLMAFVALILWVGNRSRRMVTPRAATLMELTTGYWVVAAALALMYAVGWLMPIGRLLPGFSFFRGPGRYGIVTTLTIALLAGQLLTRLSRRNTSKLTQFVILILIFGSTCGDLWLVSRMVKYSYMVNPPAISYREASEVRRMLLEEDSFPRLLAPGPNVGNLLGVSCVPWYLGIAPAEYVDPQFAMPDLPKPAEGGKPTICSKELQAWLSQSGVTHVLSFDPLDESSWQVKLLWKGIDPLLNRVWGRPEPVYLYKFQSAANGARMFPGRTYTSDAEVRAKPSDWKTATPGSRRVIVDAGQNAPATLVLTELAYPGWSVKQNGKPVAMKSSGLFRAVDCPAEGGEFVWEYHPSSVFYGAIISLVTAFILAIVGHIRFWHPSLFQSGKSRS
jgi:hypothetical protein